MADVDLKADFQGNKFALTISGDFEELDMLEAEYFTPKFTEVIADGIQRKIAAMGG